MKDTEPVIQEALKNFFSEDEIKEFSSRFQTTSSTGTGNNLQGNGFTQKQIAYHIITSAKLRAQIDLLITFAESKLSQENFLNLLLYLGQSAITLGEFNPAVDIHQKIIKLTHHSDEMQNITAHAYLYIGEIHSRQAQWELSLHNLEQAIEIFSKEKDNRGTAECENILGTIYGDQGNIDKAVLHFENALMAMVDKEDKALLGKIEINIGIVNNIRGKYDEALSYLKRALVNFETLRELRRISEIHQNMGMVFSKKKEYQSALREFDLSLEAAFQKNYLPSIGIGYISKAFIYAQMNDFVLADAFADKAMEISYKINDKLTIAEVYKIKGMVNFEASENYLLTSLRLNKELSNQLNVAESAFELGYLYKQTKQKAKSKAFLQDALNYYKSIGQAEEMKLIEELLN